MIPLKLLIPMWFGAAVAVGLVVAVLFVFRRFGELEQKHDKRASWMAVQTLGPAEAGGPESDLKRAIVAAKKGDHERARAICSKILRERPDDADAQKLLETLPCE